VEFSQFPRDRSPVLAAIRSTDQVLPKMSDCRNIAENDNLAVGKVVGQGTASPGKVPRVNLDKIRAHAAYLTFHRVLDGCRAIVPGRDSATWFRQSQEGPSSPVVVRSCNPPSRS